MNQTFKDNYGQIKASIIKYAVDNAVFNSDRLQICIAPKFDLQYNSDIQTTSLTYDVQTITIGFPELMLIIKDLAAEQGMNLAVEKGYTSPSDQLYGTFVPCPSWHPPTATPQSTPQPRTRISFIDVA